LPTILDERVNATNVTNTKGISEMVMPF